MEFRDKENNNIEYKEFIDSIDYLISVLKDIKQAVEEDNEDAAYQIFDEGFEVDFIFNTFK